MRKKKVLVHGTPNTLRAFFEDALSCDYEIVAILSAELEKVSSINFGGKEFEVLPSQEIPKLVQRLLDAIILTESPAKELCIKSFLSQGIEFHKIIIWNQENGLEEPKIKNLDNAQIGLIGGLEFQLNDEDNENRKLLSPEKISTTLVNEITSTPHQKIIASLTSWSKRISTVHLAIQTILAQTRQPDLTVLYLAKEEFPNLENDLPPELLELCSERFEIRWTKNIRSYKKLIPALKDFPNDIIVTFDDDLLYHPLLIERSLIGYKKYPEMIQCHRVKSMFFDETGNIDFSFEELYDHPTYLNEISGGLACFYPPHCLHEDVLDEEKFMTLAPTNDDIWFWLMGVLNGRRVNLVENNMNNLTYVPGTQEDDVALWKINNYGEKLFFKDLENVLNAYPVLRKVLRNEQLLIKDWKNHPWAKIDGGFSFLL